MNNLLDLALGRRQVAVKPAPTKPIVRHDQPKSQASKGRIPSKVFRALENDKIRPLIKDGHLYFNILVELESRYWTSELKELHMGGNLYYCPVTNDCYPYIKDRAVNYVSITVTNAGVRRWSVIEERTLKKHEVSSISKYTTVKYPTSEIDYDSLRKHY